MKIGSLEGGVWNGWHWRYVSTTVIALGILQVIALYTVKYPLLTSGEMAMLIGMWLIVTRAKERRFANTMVGIVSSWVISVVLQLSLTPDAAVKTTRTFLISNILLLVIGVGVSYVYFRLTMWSERRRAEADARRREKQRAEQGPAERPPVRVHRKKRRK